MYLILTKHELKQLIRQNRFSNPNLSAKYQARQLLSPQINPIRRLSREPVNFDTISQVYMFFVH